VIGTLVLAASLSLRDAASLALKESPRMAQARAGEAIAAARATQARSAWLPEIGVSETVSRGNNPVFVFGSLLEQGRFGAANFDPAFLNEPPSLTNWRRAVSLRYPLFDQLRRYTSIEMSRDAVSQSHEMSDAARQELRLRVVRAYFGLQLARERAAVAAEAVKSGEAGAEASRARADAGMIPKSELLAAEVQLADFRQQKIEAEGDVAVATAALEKLVRRPVTELETALQEKAFADVVLNDAVARGTQNRPELKAAKLASQSSEWQWRGARGSLLPRVDAMASYGASGARFSEHDSDHVIGVTLSWNVLDPARMGRIAEARASAEAARYAEVAAADDVELEIVSSFHRYHAAREKLDVGRVSVEQAESAARIVRDRYEQGLTTITEELRAQTALLRARMSLLAARYDCYVGYAELLRAMGGLDDVEPFV